MTLAAILGLYLLGSVNVQALAPFLDFLPQATQSAPSMQSANTSNPQSTQSPATTKKHHLWHRKKASNPDCIDVTATQSGNPTNSANPATPNATPANAAASASTAPGSASAASAKPCPPPKKIVRNGGAKEPEIQLVPATNAQQAAQKRSTDQLTATTKDNLKKVEGRNLSSSQQEMMNQVKLFLKQSKDASVQGDADLAHSLAQKAQLLSEELAKP